MDRRRLEVILLRDGREDPAFTTALTPGASTICVACRPVDLLATLIRVAFSAGHSGTPWYGGLSGLTRLCLEFVDKRSRFICHIK
jgi:hypothetical protein